MPMLNNKSQYDKRIIKEYIVSSYMFRQDAFKSLCYDDDDEGDNNLHAIFVDLNQKQRFENKIIDLIETAIRVNKYEKLILLLQRKNPAFERDIGNSSISSSPTIANLNPSSQSNKQWVKNKESPKGILGSSIQQEEKYLDEPVDSPQIEKLRREIEHLERNIGSLSEIDNLLENVRQKISGLLLEIKVKHQMIQDERARAASKSSRFRREPEIDFLASKPTAVRRQPFSNPSSSWQGTAYSKPN